MSTPILPNENLTNPFYYAQDVNGFAETEFQRLCEDLAQKQAAEPVQASSKEMKKKKKCSLSLLKPVSPPTSTSTSYVIRKATGRRLHLIKINIYGLNGGEQDENINGDTPSVSAQYVVKVQTNILKHSNLNSPNIRKTKSGDDSPVSPTHVKRKMLNSYFDHKSKRKFPGPAGLLTGSFEEKKDESICQMELLSQDVDFSQNYIHGDVFETPLWKRLLEDTKSFNEINTIRTIKTQALAGNLQRKKAHIVTAFIESVDRSAIDPLITLRDKTGHIKCTLHRDAWLSFSPYIVAEYCALVIWKPTVLTTGSAFKKHYLNITLSNIWAIYSSVMNNEDEALPDGFLKNCEEDFTVIKMDRSKTDVNNFSLQNESIQESFDDLDNVFLDDVF